MSGFRRVLLHFRGKTVHQRLDPPASWADWRPGKFMRIHGVLGEVVAAWPAYDCDDILEVDIREVTASYVMDNLTAGTQQKPKE